MMLPWVLPLRAASPFPALITRDKVQANAGVFLGGSLFTTNGGGHTGKAGDYAIDFGQGTGPVFMQDGRFLNVAGSNNAISVALWIKHYDVSAGSAFWANSPSSDSGQRGIQAHLPWSDNHLYFDTAGCCNGLTQRIQAGIDTFPDYSGFSSWWTLQWHFLVLAKKGSIKQIWIDGKLFLQGTNTAALPVDMIDLHLGSDGAGLGLLHGMMDDFAVFGTALDGTTIGQLFAGTLPSALPGTNQLLAYWDFNDFPAAGEFMSVLPAPDSTNAAPDLIRVVHLDGVTPWDPLQLSLVVDGTPVLPSFVRDGPRLTIGFVPNPPFAARSPHKASLGYPVPGGRQTNDWQFVVSLYTQDRVTGRFGLFRAGSGFSPGGGHTGAPGDGSASFGLGTGPVYVPTGAFLNEASRGDEITVSVWVKKFDNTNSSAFWASSPSSGVDRRGLQANIPQADNHVYFDTAGCCDPRVQRTQAAVDTFPGYSGNLGWWTNQWHLFVFTKKAAGKKIWIDGQLLVEGTNTAALPLDMADLSIGSDGLGGALFHGLVDDFAVFKTALGTDDIGRLFAGITPVALPPATGLLAWWDFNDAATVMGLSPKFRILSTGSAVVITSDPQPLPPGFVLQRAPSATGPWITMQGFNTPTNFPLDAVTGLFLRAVKQ